MPNERKRGICRTRTGRCEGRTFIICRASKQGRSPGVGWGVQASRALRRSSRPCTEGPPGATPVGLRRRRRCRRSHRLRRRGSGTHRSSAPRGGRTATSSTGTPDDAWEFVETPAYPSQMNEQTLLRTPPESLRPDAAPPQSAVAPPKSDRSPAAWHVHGPPSTSRKSASVLLPVPTANPLELTRPSPCPVEHCRCRRLRPRPHLTCANNNAYWRAKRTPPPPASGGDRTAGVGPDAGGARMVSADGGRGWRASPALIGLVGSRRRWSMPPSPHAAATLCKPSSSSSRQTTEAAAAAAAAAATAAPVAAAAAAGVGGAAPYSAASAAPETPPAVRCGACGAPSPPPASRACLQRRRQRRRSGGAARPELATASPSSRVRSG